MTKKKGGKKSKNVGGRPCKYPWRELKKVGDEFVTYGEFSTVVFAMKRFMGRNKEFRFSAVDMGGGNVQIRRIK